MLLLLLLLFSLSLLSFLLLLLVFKELFLLDIINLDLSWKNDKNSFHGPGK